MWDQSVFSKTITKTLRMWLLTVTCTGAEAAMAAPAPSSARAATACAPFATEKLSQVTSNGAAGALATAAPSTWNSTFRVPAGTVAERSTAPAITAPFASLSMAMVDGGDPESPDVPESGVPESAGVPLSVAGSPASESVGPVLVAGVPLPPEQAKTAAAR